MPDMMPAMVAMVPLGAMMARLKAMNLRREIIDPRIRAVRIRGRTLRRGRRSIGATLRMLGGGACGICATLRPLRSGPGRLCRGIGRIGGGLSALHRSGRGTTAEHQSSGHKNCQGHSTCKSQHQNLPNLEILSQRHITMGLLLRQHGRSSLGIVTARKNMVNNCQDVRFHRSPSETPLSLNRISSDDAYRRIVRTG